MKRKRDLKARFGRAIGYYILGIRACPQIIFAVGGSASFATGIPFCYFARGVGDNFFCGAAVGNTGKIKGELQNHAVRFQKSLCIFVFKGNVKRNIACSR